MHLSNFTGCPSFAREFWFRSWPTTSPNPNPATATMPSVRSRPAQHRHRQGCYGTTTTGFCDQCQSTMCFKHATTPTRATTTTSTPITAVPPIAAWFLPNLLSARTRGHTKGPRFFLWSSGTEANPRCNASTDPAKRTRLYFRSSGLHEPDTTIASTLRSYTRTRKSWRHSSSNQPSFQSGIHRSLSFGSWARRQRRDKRRFRPW